MVLTIQYMNQQDASGRPLFILSNGRINLHSVPLPPPDSVVGYDEKSLPQCLYWYLEEYLRNPLGPGQINAEATVTALENWGTQVFDAIFDRDLYMWYADIRRNNQLDKLQIRIVSESPAILSWPWEALCDNRMKGQRQGRFLAPHCCIDRSPDGNPASLPSPGKTDKLRMLLVIARPYGEKDVWYHAVARAVVDYVREKDLPVEIDVLRPPTFENLQKTLDRAKDNGSPYHILHFDGHGGYDVLQGPSDSVTGGPQRFQGAEGCLAFETEPKPGQEVEPYLVKARDLGQMLFQCGVSMVAMNACQSAMIDGSAESAYASVAASLISAGVGSVTAMGYSLYVSGAKEFVPAFYQQLFKKGDPASAMRWGRKAMFIQPNRDWLLGKLPLQDWIVPELYQNIVAGKRLLPTLKPSGKKTAKGPVIIPDDALKQDKDYFIGRGQAILELERLTQRDGPAGILVHGIMGAGKTTLIKGFLSWLRDTGGLRAEDGSPCPVVWFDFRAIKSGTYIVHVLAEKLLGDKDSPDDDNKRQRVVNLLRKKRAFVVWDNFESATGAPGTEAEMTEADRQYLKDFLARLRGGKTKFFITSRTAESWLPRDVCARMKGDLEGLRDEELWEYCGQIAQELDVTLDPKNDELLALLDSLDGNPLAVRWVMLRLKDTEPAEISRQLETSFRGAEGDESTRRIMAAFDVLTHGIDESMIPVLQALGLHEHYADAGMMVTILCSADQLSETDNQAIQETALCVAYCFSLLENAGLCFPLDETIYRLHPALRSYLAERFPPPNDIQYRFARGIVAIEYAALNDEKQRRRFFFLHEANLRRAQRIAEAMEMPEEDLYLTSALVMDADVRGNLAQAETQCKRLVEKGKRYGHSEEEVSAYNKLSYLAYMRGDRKNEQYWTQRAADVWQDEKNGNLDVQQLLTLGNNTEKQGNLGTAMRYYERAAVLSEQEGDRWGTPIYGLLGNLAGLLSDNPKQEHWLKKFYDAAEEQRDTTLMANANCSLATFEKDQGNFPEAEKRYRQSLALFKQLGDNASISFTHWCLGDLYVMAGKPDAAKDEFTEALNIATRLNLEVDIAYCYWGLGEAALLESAFSSAKVWLEKALEIYDKMNHEEEAAAVRTQLQALEKELSGGKA